VVLYEMLTGELPVSRIDRPSSRASGTVQIDVRLDAIVLRALDFRPERRYRTAMEFKSEVEGIVKEGSTTTINELRSSWRQKVGAGAKFIAKWVIAPAVGLLVAALITHLILPTEYHAVGMIDVKPDDYAELRKNPYVQLQSAAQAYYFDRQFIATQTELIRRREMFDHVMKDAHIYDAHGDAASPTRMDDLYQIYRRDVSVDGVPGTSILKIGAYHANAERASELADRVLVSYRSFRLEGLQANIDRKLSPLQNEVAKQRKVVLDAAQEMDRIRGRDGIQDPDPDSTSFPVTSSSGQKLGILPYTDAKTIYLQAKHILQNAEEALSKARMELSIDIDPVKVIERPTSPARKAPFSPRRLITRLFGAAN